MRSLLLALTVATAGSCTRQLSSVAPGTRPVDADEYVIYRQVLADMTSSGPSLVLARADMQPDSSILANSPPDLREAFATASQSPRWIDASALRARHATVVSDTLMPARRTDLQEEERAWAELHERYGRPLQFIHFSRVGFNASRTRAEVMYAAQSGPDCNSAVMVTVYVRSAAGWRSSGGSVSMC